MLWNVILINNKQQYKQSYWHILQDLKMNILQFWLILLCITFFATASQPLSPISSAPPHLEQNAQQTYHEQQTSPTQPLSHAQHPHSMNGSKIEKANLLQGSSKKQMSEQMQKLNKNKAAKEQMQLDPWVRNQLKAAESAIIQTGESFIMLIQGQRSRSFIWPSLHAKTRLMRITVVKQGDDGELGLQQNPKKEQYVEVSSWSKAAGKIVFGFVYIERLLKVEYRGETSVEIYNRCKDKVFVWVQLEMESRKINQGVGDHQFLEAGIKIKAIQQSLEQTYVGKGMSFKWQWGFQEREERYESWLLHLTAIELLTIIITAFVQIFCIKRLIDNYYYII